ncbi:hypothetical protein LTR36_008568 [Oleoguttula mirabilis]|uniref:Uncharacterized protein n=1 Tax=Oleoguttula mirabilis TaxID=1507867 RepID=A0AAV9JTD3_9PEZI|nr:hypothetical protein LTR36_008568 [Oleoguttula mirabilis]
MAKRKAPDEVDAANNTPASADSETHENEDVQQPRKRHKPAIPKLMVPRSRETLRSNATMENMSSGLLALPPELRNEIYCLALVGEEVTVDHSAHDTPGLLGTCRQTRKEASSIF